ncbi:hypothetical protein IFM89_015368 [Coptis chinensis]|uniref:histone acetyltransferase n=1 Tax=Coptis chinensis TaxID=261450 RepID=A0A835IAW7_9MAGN|nr:hypothetical protein IFM89_015368 [Coptis chinensis]
MVEFCKSLSSSLEIYGLKMHMQTHMSGQVSGRLPNQAGSQLSGLPLHAGNSVPLQNLGGLRNTYIMDPDLEMRRKSLSDKIYQILVRQKPIRASPEMQPKMKDIVRKLEEGLFKNAASKEEYSNVDTLEQRLQALIKLLPVNHNKQFSRLPSSSSSISTMIPTPGIPQSGNMNLKVTSSLENSVNAASGYNALAANTVNIGNSLQNANGSTTGGIYGGSFSTSDGPLSNGYQQSPAQVSNGSSGNNMSVFSRRVASQMIPTPGLSNLQSPMSSESSYHSGGYSGVESTMASHSHLQPTKYIDGQNNHILPSFGGQVGTGMISTLQQNLSSHAFPNSASSVGSVLTGNDMQLVNGPPVSESYLTALKYGDDFRMNMADLSESGNLYGTGSYVGSMTNNQNSNNFSVHPKSNTNSSSTSTQPNMQKAKQTMHMKPQMLDSSSNMNFPVPHVSQPEFQKFQQNDHQSQKQFLQQQHKKRQQSQPHQLMLKMESDPVKQTQQTSNLGSQPMSELQLGSDIMHSQNSEQYLLSDLPNQFQQNTDAGDSRGGQMLCLPPGTQEFDSSLSQNSQHMHQVIHPRKDNAESPNKFNCISGRPEPGAVLQGQWHSELKEKLHLPVHPLNEADVQEAFHQRTTGQDEAQRPRVFSEGAVSADTGATRSTILPSDSGGATRGHAVVTCEPRYLNMRRWLLFLIHARGCSAPEGKCQEVNCITVQKLLKHMKSCKSDRCSNPRCGQTKILTEHYKNCHYLRCPICAPVHHYLELHKACSHPSSDLGSSWKPINGRGAAKVALKTDQSTVITSEDLQSPLKRLKTDHFSKSFMDMSENIPGSVPGVNLSQVSQDAPSQVCQTIGFPNSVKDEAVEKKAELTEHPGLASRETVAFAEKQIGQVKQEIRQETSSVPVEHATGTKSGKPKVKGVSLTELFTPHQIREHIMGLRQWVGQSKAKAEKNQAMERAMNENSCQLCAVEKLAFEPPPMYCTPCGTRIKRNALFYAMGSGDARHYFCIPCYNDARGDSIEIDGTAVLKADLEKKRNDEETEEWWVQCDKCEAWQHQICALFNGRRNDGGQAEYTCPNCCIEEIERGERKPLPQNSVLGAKDLPTTILSEHIENRLFKGLKQERQDRAKHLGKNPDEVPGAEALVVRVVSSVDKKLEVKERFLEIFQEENYPKEYPYKSKVILLFQKIEGVEVCLFGMYVQEFGSECECPNERRVYISYLDSVKYFRPEIRTVSGEALRTFVYHEILIGYLEYCKTRGFTSCYIWACPPLKGEDYILYCHPEIQKTPKSDKLREWYLAMLRKAIKEKIVVDLTNLYDQFFVSTGECKAKVTAARLPYFDGDYWPGAAEDMINQLRQEEDGRKQYKKGKTKKIITKRALKAAGQTDLSGNASKDALLMQKLGETIYPMKEDFIMVHLQHACTHCCRLMVFGNRWVCNQCRNFQLCDKCYDAEQTVEERNRHPINSRDKHALYPVQVRDVSADTKDRDDILESEFFDTRQAFLSLCQGNHYQYDTLRRAKHSSMMILYHLHNPTAPAFVTTCNICHNDVETGQGWRCEICPDYDVCNACIQKGGVDHPHKLTHQTSLGDRDAQNKEGRQKRVLQLRKMLDLVVHASQCRSANCPYLNCRKVKGLFKHGQICRTRASGGCSLCKKMWDLKEHLRRSQQQSDSRRRAAVMEMMRQRAAEVAGTAG